MRIPARVGELLLRAGVIDELQLKAALAEQERWGHRLGATLINLGMVGENRLVQVLAQQLGLPATSLTGRRIAPEVIALVPARIARDQSVLPLCVKRTGSAGKLFLGMEDPSKLEVLDDLCFRTGLEIQPVMMGPSELINGIGRYYDRKNETVCAEETILGEGCLGFSKAEKAAARGSRDRAVEFQERPIGESIQAASRDNEILLSDLASEPPLELSQQVDAPSHELEKTRLVVKALTQLLVENQLLSLDEIQDRVAKLKGGVASVEASTSA